MHRTRRPEPLPRDPGAKETVELRRNGHMTLPHLFPEPAGSTADVAQLFSRYLDFYRETVLRKVSALPERELTASRLSSGWSPWQLVNHLGYMERRWLVWGFLGEPVADPWGDEQGGRWHVVHGSLAETAELLRAVGRRTTAVLGTRGLEEHARTGGR